MHVSMKRWMICYKICINLPHFCQSDWGIHWEKFLTQSRGAIVAFADWSQRYIDKSHARGCKEAAVTGGSDDFADTDVEDTFCNLFAMHIADYPPLLGGSNNANSWIK